MGMHDLQFRKTFTEVEMFRAACEVYLPQEVKDKLDFTTLALRQMSGAFIRNLIIMEHNVDPEKDAELFEQLKEEISDVMYRCSTYDGNEVLLIAHAEHQSTPDKNYPVRNALYDISALKDFIASEKPDKYPLIISFLVYHGKPSPYPYPTDILDNFKERQLAAKYFLKPILIDYRQVSDAELLEHGEISGLEIALKHSFDEDVDDTAVKKLMQGMRKCTKIELRRQWFMYALRTWQAKPNAMLKEYKDNLNEDEVFVMTAAEQLRQQGMQQGIQQGMQQGMQEGYTEGQKETAKRMLADGMAIELVAKYANLDKESLQELLKPLS